MPVSRIKIFSLVGLYLIALGCAKLEQCKSKQVEGDLARHVTIHYSLCADPNSVCFYDELECEPEEFSETITKAEIVDENGDWRTLKVQDYKEFDVLLPTEGERFTDTGIFHYNISYEYEAECIYPLDRDCIGWVRDLRLSVTVVDYKLKLLPSSDISVTGTTDELLIHPERNVSLACSSGLSDKFSSLNIPVIFTFHSKHGSNYHNMSATCERSDTDSVDNSWIITREQSPPYDCVLTIVDFGEHNSGKYRCTGVLSQSDSVSPSLHLKFKTKLQTATAHSFSFSQDLGSWATIFFGILVIFIAAIFLSVLAIGSYSAYRWYKRRRHGLFQNLPRFNGYGSTSTICDLSRPHTPNPNSDAEDHPFQQYGVSEDDTDTCVSEMESSVDRPHNHNRSRYAKGHRRGNFSSDSTSEDTESDHPNRFTDGELTDIAIAGIGETPPCRHQGACDMSLICQYCGKAYCISQSQFCTRHEKKCQRPAITSTSDSEPGPTTANIPISNDLNLSAAVQFHHQEPGSRPGSPSEVHRDTHVQSPAEAAAAVDGSRVDQSDLNFMSESDRSNPPTSNDGVLGAHTGPTTANIAHISSDLNPSAALQLVIHHQPGSPSEGHRDTQSPTEAAAAVDSSRVDQSDLNFMSESDRSNPPTSNLDS